MTGKSPQFRIGNGYDTEYFEGKCVIIEEIQMKYNPSYGGI